MSRRPREGRDAMVTRAVSRMAPGGLWRSEAPVRRPLPRVKQMGGPAVLCPSALYLASGPTWAEYGPTTLLITGTVDVTWDTTHPGDISVWLESVTEDPGAPLTWIGTVPAPPLVVTGPGSGTGLLPLGDELPGHVGQGTVARWRIAWDVPGAFAGLCSTMIEGG